MTLACAGYVMWKNVTKTVATLVCSAGARNTLGPIKNVRIDILENANGKEALEDVSEMKSVTISMLVRQMWK